MVMCTRLFAAIATLSLSLFSGCAIHPLPEDVTGVDTVTIVRQIRCEAREAVKGELIAWLELLAADHPYQKGDPIAQRLLALYAQDPDQISTFSPKLFPGSEYKQVRNLINTFANTGIAYNFDLTMTENNDLTGGADFLKPLFNGKFTLGVSAGAMRERKNNRIFTITDTFGSLIQKVNTPVRGHRYCDGHVVYANYIYPIVGRVGVDEVVRTFIRLTLFGNLAATADKATAEKPGAPTMADQLSFTTLLTASANPSVVFSPAGTKFQVVDANLMAGVKRSDVHKVTLGLALESAGVEALTPLRSFLFSRERSGGFPGTVPTVRQVAAAPLYVGNRVTGGGSPSERLAVITVDQFKSRELELIVNP
jgi:hypothetical protein